MRNPWLAGKFLAVVAGCGAMGALTHPARDGAHSATPFPSPKQVPAPRNSAPQLSSPEVTSTEPQVIVPTSHPPKEGITLHLEGSSAPVDKRSPLSEFIVNVVSSMPSGGSYDTTSAAIKGLQKAVGSADHGELIVKPELAKQSFCSGATYLVFLSVLEQLQMEGGLTLAPETIELLRIKDRQADGSGVWGRWNANGPGTARLFFELHMGRSFTDFQEAKPGDFLKIFWNENIGSKEFGHSVIYMGSYVDETGQTNVRFWSSNRPGGFGFKSVPMSRIKRAVFTRLENPDAVNRIAQIPSRDQYLAAMSKRPGTEEEMLTMIGISGP